MTRKIITMAAWLVLIVLVAATLSPIELRPHSGLPVDCERAAAYGVLGGLLGLAADRSRLLSLDIGKPIGDAFIETLDCLTACLFARSSPRFDVSGSKTQ